LQALSFWVHHAQVDVRHAAWAEGAMDDSGGDAVAQISCAREAAERWWAFLDEREALAPVAA
jgi:pyrroloquinoline quinone (PQQ) biosynthesis protein C